MLLTTYESKKNKNIFEKKILHESLFYQEVQKTYKVAGMKIEPGWLADKDPQTRYLSTRAAIQLSELQDNLKQLENRFDLENQMNLFKIAQLKRKIEAFQAGQITKNQQQQFNDNFRYDDTIIVQKVTGFLNSNYERPGKLHGTQIAMQSKKSRDPHIIQLQQYNIELQQKNAGQHRPQFQNFKWLEDEKCRIILYGDNLKPYCIYTPNKKPEKFRNMMKINLLQTKKINSISKLSELYHTKIIILFAEKLRHHDWSIKYKKLKQRQMNSDLENKIFSINNLGFNLMIPQKDPSNQSMDASSIEAPSTTRKIFSQDNGIFSPPFKAKNLNMSSVFRLKGRRQTIHYNELQQPVNLAENDLKSEDIQLGIKQVAISEEDINDKNDMKSFMLERSQRASEYHHSENQFYGNQQNQSFYQTKISSPKQKPRGQSIFLQNYDEFLNQQEVYCRVQKPLSIYAVISKLKFLVPSQRKQFILQIRQVIDPEDQQYQNMRTMICCKYQIKFNLLRDNIYISNQNKDIKLSPASTKYIFTIKNQAQSVDRLLKLPNDVKYQINASQLFYSEQFKAKIVIHLSNKPIVQFPQMRTLQFLRQYLTTQKQSYQFKANFVNNMRKQLQIAQQWNKRLMKKIVNSNDSITFQKAMFLAIPDSILDKLQKQAIKQFGQNMPEILEFSLNENKLKLIQQTALDRYYYELKSIIKPTRLIYLMIQRIGNNPMNKRLRQIKLYFLKKYGNLNDLHIIFIKEIVRKIGPILTMCKNEEQLTKVVELYYEVEYEIDELFVEISKYYNPKPKRLALIHK